VAIVRGLPKRGCHEQAPAVLGLMTATRDEREPPLQTAAAWRGLVRWVHPFM